MEALSALSQGLADAVERLAGSVVAVEAGQGPGATGVVWPGGLVVASDEALGGDEDLAIVTAAGRRVPATLLGRDPGTNTALVRPGEDAGLAPAGHGDAGTLRVGDLVLAVGIRAGGVAAAFGLVHAVGPRWRSRRGGEIDRQVLLDIRLPRALEGAAVVDAGGRLVGVAASGPGRSVLLLPVATVGRAVEQLAAHGRIRRGYLGAAMQPVRLPESLRAGLPQPSGTGVVILEVQAGTPAEAAGLLPGDILVSLDGSPVGDPRDVFALLGPDSVGRELRAGLVRGGSAAEVAVTPAERPAR